MFSAFRGVILGVIVFLYVSLSAQNFNMTFRSNLQFPGQTCANVWYYVDSLNNEYALVGTSKGLSIVDVTDPDNLVFVKRIPGPDNLWKEVRTYKKFAYVASEGGGGLQIIDLSSLPDTNNIVYHNWAPTYNTTTLNTIHTVQITDGYIYMFGGTFSSALIADLEPDPYNPVIAGHITSNYIHDGYVRNNVLYAAHIANGNFSLIDVSDKANGAVKQIQGTPGSTTHNTWLSDDSQTLFTTDENSGSFLTAYDISDTSDITEADRIQQNPGAGAIVHNCHVLNDWVVNSYYTDGVVVVDGHRPGNLVITAVYDTYPSGGGCCYNGAWGVCPYLPSGNILASNIGEGLFVLTPNYIRACYLEGMVTDSVTTFPINRATVSITAVSLLDSSKITGDYAVGTRTPGTYSVTFTKTGYIPKTITGVSLTAGNIVNLNVALAPIGSGINSNEPQSVLTAYPNPFENTITIELNSASLLKPDVIFVRDVAGKIVEHVSLNTTSRKITIGNELPAGVYFIEYSGSKPLKVFKYN